MTFDQLRYFFEAAKFQHVGKAAKSIHISPSAISSAIAALESELGCRLFDRLGKRITLTERGRLLKDEAAKISEHLTSLRPLLLGEPTELRGSFRLGASHFLATHVLTRAWTSLHAQHPDLTVEISSLSTIQTLTDVVSGALDLGLCFSPFQHPELSQIIIHRGKLVIAVRKRHPILKLKKGRSSLRALETYPAALHKGQPGVDLCEAHPIFRRYGITPKTRMLFDSDSCAIQHLSTSNSWALIPEVVAKSYIRTTQILQLPPDWDAHYFVALVVRKGKESSILTRTLQNTLLSAFKTT